MADLGERIKSRRLSLDLTQQAAAQARYVDKAMKTAPGPLLAVGLPTDQNTPARLVGRLALAAALAQLEWLANVIAKGRPISPLRYPAELGCHCTQLDIWWPSRFGASSSLLRHFEQAPSLLKSRPQIFATGAD